MSTSLNTIYFTRREKKDATGMLEWKINQGRDDGAKRRPAGTVQREGEEGGAL